MTEPVLVSSDDATLIVRSKSNLVRIVPPHHQVALFPDDTVSFRKDGKATTRTDGELYGACLSEDRRYRYVLWRIWDKTKGVCVFVMLNPSKADEDADDPTIRMCVSLAKRWGFGGIRVVNLFAYRATNPKELDTAIGPTGDPVNLDWIVRECLSAERVIIAWGAHGTKLSRATHVLRRLFEAKIELHHLGRTKAGAPKHPLARGKHRIPADIVPEIVHPMDYPEAIAGL